MMRANVLTSAVLLSCSFLAAQTQSFNVGQWFFGKNVTSDLPAGVTDLSDNMWASTTYTCPLLMTGTKPAQVAQIACQPNQVSGRFLTVIAEGDARLAGTRLAIPTMASSDTGRYLTSMVRPEERNLYFTSVSGNNALNFSHQIAWRYRNYTTLERVAGPGDPVTVRQVNGATLQATVTAAGPMDSNVEGREFLYLESGGSNIYGLFELKADGVFEQLFPGRLLPRDTPWGMGGFVFNDGGLAFRQSSTVYNLDPNPSTICKPCLTLLAQGGMGTQLFMPPQLMYANLDLTQFFRPTNDLTTHYFNWATAPGMFPNEMFSVWRDFTQAPYYTNALATANATTAATLAIGDRVEIMGAGPRGGGTVDFDPSSKITVPWAFTALWLNRGGNWLKILRDVELPDSTFNDSKKYYQGVAAFNCQVEFATKRYDSSFDNSGPFYGFYRLYRPCIDSATFNTVTGELVIHGVNLQDQRTEIGVPPVQPPPPGAPLGVVLPSRVTSVTPVEVHATLTSVPTLDRVLVLVNGQVWSDPVKTTLISQGAPILGDLVDVNFDHTPAAPSKLMTAQGLFACQTAQTTSVAYPLSLGNCAVLLDNNIRLPLLFTGNQQINFLMPSNLAASAHDIRVTRQDANGTFTSGPFGFNSSPSVPVAIRTSGNVIVVVIRNGQVVVAGPNDPIHPGEYFTVYISGAEPAALASVKVGTVDAVSAAAAVNWAQGVVQVNVVAPTTTPPLGAVQVKIGETAAFPVRIN